MKSQPNKSAERVAAYLGTGYTLWTWIKYEIRSKDPRHCRRVRAGMLAELERAMHAGKVVRCKSIKGRTSYRLAR